MDQSRTAEGTPDRPISRAVLLSRVAHALVAVLFLSCIGVVYVSAFRSQTSPVTLAAVAALGIEGALVLLSGGDCPLGPLLRRIGDDTPLFELVLPPRAARLAVPVLGGITVLGFVLLAVRVS